jgi:nucleoside-diphosphate-sugar epimerase
MTIVVTGANGFLGAHVTHALRARPRDNEVVLGLGSSDVEALMASGAFLDWAQSVDLSTIVHLAWLHTSATDYEHDRRNHQWAKLTVDICQAAEQLRAFFVGTGTCLEDDTNEPTSDYVAAKRAAYIGCLDTLPSEQFSWLRPHYVFSVAERRPRLLREAFALWEDNNQFVPSEPDRMHDFIEVRDVASAFRLVAEERVPGKRDVGSGTLRSVTDLLARARPLPVGSLDSREVGGAGCLTPADMHYLDQWAWQCTHTNEFFGVSQGEECHGHC